MLFTLQLQIEKYLLFEPFSTFGKVCVAISWTQNEGTDVMQGVNKVKQILADVILNNIELRLPDLDSLLKHVQKAQYASLKSSFIRCPDLIAAFDEATASSLEF